MKQEFCWVGHHKELLVQKEKKYSLDTFSSGSCLHTIPYHTLTQCCTFDCTRQILWVQSCMLVSILNLSMIIIAFIMIVFLAIYFSFYWLLPERNFFIGPRFNRQGPMLSTLSVCWSIRFSVFKYQRDRSLVFSNFGPRVYPKGSLVIALVRVCVHPSLNISETAH